MADEVSEDERKEFLGHEFRGQMGIGVLVSAVVDIYETARSEPGGFEGVMRRLAQGDMEMRVRRRAEEWEMDPDVAADILEYIARQGVIYRGR